jgi:hypothetical protein
MIFSLSSGLTTVLLVAPASPPAMKYDEISGLNSVGLRAGSATVCARPVGAASASLTADSGGGCCGRDWEGDEEGVRSDVMTTKAQST